MNTLQKKHPNLFPGGTRLACFLLAIAAMTAQGGQSHAQPSSATVTRIPQVQIRTQSASIDRYMHAATGRGALPAGRRVSDETFVRRIYLDLAGRIPTFAETQGFLNDSHPRRRSNLIDALLDAESYPLNFYNFWADLLRVKTRIGGGLGPVGSVYADWIKNALRENMPYDDMVTELLTAKGALWAEDNGALGYYFRDRGMPLDNMANTVRVFLGTRIECAQCHDHPFDIWTRRDFFEMAAFTSGQGNLTLASFQETQKTIRRLSSESEFNREQLRLARPLFNALSAGLDNTGNGKIRLPDDYQYDNASPQDLIAAKPLFGHWNVTEVRDEPIRGQKKLRNRKAGRRHPGVGSREDFAAWITSPDTPRFTTVIVNRLWKEVFGRGLFEPLDDIHEDTKTPHADLLAKLETLMRDLNYDMKQFLRVLYNTELYESSVVTRDIEPGQVYPGGGPLLRRMTAEQIWDSLLTLTVPDLDHRKAPEEGLVQRFAYNKYKDYSATQLISETQSLIESAFEESMMGPNILRALESVFRRETGPKDDYFSVLRSEKQQLQGKIRDARRKGMGAEVQRLQRLSATRGFDNPALFDRSYLRAAELDSPAPPGHFIREFGGSDREQIDNAYDSPSVPQVLSLLNGYVDKNLLSNRNSVLWKNVEAAGSNNDKIKVIYKSLLSREPTREEMTMATRDIRAHGQEALDDVVWVLVNSREFLFVL